MTTARLAPRLPASTQAVSAFSIVASIQPAFIGEPLGHHRCWPQNGNGSDGEGERSRPCTHEKYRRKEQCPWQFIALLQHSAFGPDDLDRIVTAYEATLRALRADRTDPAAETVAKTIMQIAQTGVRDPTRLRQLALKELAPAK